MPWGISKKSVLHGHRSIAKVYWTSEQQQNLYNTRLQWKLGACFCHQQGTVRGTVSYLPLWRMQVKGGTVWYLLPTWKHMRNYWGSKGCIYCKWLHSCHILQGLATYTGNAHCWCTIIPKYNQKNVSSCKDNGRYHVYGSKGGNAEDGPDRVRVLEPGSDNCW